MHILNVSYVITDECYIMMIVYKYSLVNYILSFHFVAVSHKPCICTTICFSITLNIHYVYVLLYLNLTNWKVASTRPVFIVLLAGNGENDCEERHVTHWIKTI